MLWEGDNNDSDRKKREKDRERERLTSHKEGKNMAEEIQIRSDLENR